MSLDPGVRLGPYEILTPIGAGGMGEVYRARDTKLDRDIALKVLPEVFVADPERVARFQREAKALAALNHPNIATIHGLEEANPSQQPGQAVHALVMELVDGPTLADRIAHGAIPLDDALPIASQIALALEAAHEQGIVHRDLKPANIKVRPNGAVKVLDFGLAKLASDGGSGAGRPSGLSQSPTLTSPVATLAGTILGTAAYMAPEQARGKPVDKRADIWAFGCVLFEMLTGRRAFGGDDVSDTLASVLKDQPDWSALPTETPTAIRRLLRRALEKDVARRLGAIVDGRLEIDEVLTGVSDRSEPHVAVAAPPTRVWRRALPWTTGAAIGLALGVIGVLSTRAPANRSPATPPMQVAIDLGAAVAEVLGSSTLALSPDGTTVAFVGSFARPGGGQLYVRRLGQLNPTMLEAPRAIGPFFSPDGQWVAFFADGKLKKIHVNGGAAIPICDVANTSRGGAWGEDGTIVFNDSPAAGTPLLRVSANGGKPERLTTLGPGEVTHRWPQVLPHARAVLYTASGSANNVADANIVAWPLPSGPAKIVQRGGTFGRYVASGHLLYVRNGSVFAVRFDPERLEAVGQPVAVIEGVAGTDLGNAMIAASDTGTLIYLRGQTRSQAVPILWLRRDGTTAPLRTVAADWRFPQFSPDGRLLAFGADDRQQTDVWMYDWERDIARRITFETAYDGQPVWAPDGQRVAFASDRAEPNVMNLYSQRADGTGEVQRLTESRVEQRPTSWHPSGKFIAFQEGASQADVKIMILPMEGSEESGWRPGKPFVFVPAIALNAMFSPDGKWIAYQSNESGDRNRANVDIFVRPFPGPGGRWQISTAGGMMPTWSRARKELFYLAPDNRIMVVSYTVAGASFEADKPRVWSEQPVLRRPGSRAIDLHPDGERFAVAVPEPAAAPDLNKIVLVSNFFDELRRLLPVTK